MGFTFDDNAKPGAATPLKERERLIKLRPELANVIRPYLGGEEINADPQHAFHRYVIDLGDLSEDEARTRYPELIRILEEKVRPVRALDKREAYRRNWWRFAERRARLAANVSSLSCYIACSRVSPRHALAFISSEVVASEATVIFAFSNFAPFSLLQSRIHEIWARFFSSSMKDDLRYTPSDCFRTFPFPVGFETDAALEEAGEVYHSFRSRLMIDRGQGLTKTYNRFHARNDSAQDVVRLRQLHDEMDRAVLRAYGWNDLADRAAPEFIEQEADEGKKPKTKFDWPAEFKDEVFAKLLALNAERAAAERAAGVVSVPDEEDEDTDEEVDA